MNKFGKSKVVGVAAASLAAVAVASVGFSAWVVTTRKDASISDITVNVAEVKKDSVVLNSAEVIYPEGKSNILFDAVEGKSTVLKNKGGAQQLAFGLKINYTISKDAAFKGLAAWMEVTQGCGTSTVGDGTTGEKDKYIISPIKLGTTDSHANTTDIPGFASDDKLTKDGAAHDFLTKADAFSFSWGDAFGNDNPSNTATSGNVDGYIQKLEAMKNKPYKFVIHLVILENA